jgi:two-component system sensor histidine kinase BarA
MGGYKSLKRVLGETHLGRKLRWLFGISLLLLIFVAFSLVDWICEDLVMKNIHRNGREWVRYYMIETHWSAWENNPDYKPVRDEMARNLLEQDFEAHTITEDAAWVKRMGRKNQRTRNVKGIDKQINRIEPADEEELPLLEKLKTKFDRVLADHAAATGAAATATDPAAAEENRRKLLHQLEGVFATRVGRKKYEQDGRLVESKESSFFYYQPVLWDTKSCSRCHAYEDRFDSRSSIAASDIEATASSGLPYLVTRVDLPYATAQSSINWIRAVLSTVGILTVFLSMVALWMVVRYLVLKPLSHLREVSDSVTRGDLDQRAEINTNDEFQELAASFNKMLRHLIEAQGQLQEANTELDGKVDQLAQLNMQLHEMNRLKGEFLANMSHELRTPLNSIIGFSEMLGGIESLDDKQKRFVHNIQKSGKKLLEMINDILDLAKLEAGKTEVRSSEFRIETIINTQCDMVRNLAEDKNIDLTTEVEAELPLLYQDQTKVQQILTNLLSNAIKFTPEGGRITVSAKGDPRGFIEISVADTGVGIAESDREIIFEKFRQGSTVLGRDNLTREYSGTGLGLSIVKELCKLLGGEVHVTSELGRGSTFRVLIPWMRAEAPQHASKLNARLDELTRPRRAEPSESVSAEAVAAGK